MELSNNSYKIAAGVGLVVLIVVTVVLFGFHLFEAENVQRGSIAYYLGLPPSVRSIPLTEECQAPVYRWRGRDGESSPYISTTYSSRSTAQYILAFYKTALAKLSCSPETTTSASFTDKGLIQFNCRRPDILSISVWVGGESPCRTVTLDIIENY
ncbi:MAG: hypothetical protein HYS20_09860 [Rhodocyclales bacterium]|nr:hypothetical protein [Rhodocyclales bacterium]